jgi:hypothetical protein
MSIGYQDEWDTIQNALIMAGNAPSMDRTRAEDAIKIKFAVESIQQQRNMTELQNSLLRTTKNLTWATVVLAFFTAVLVIVTAFR